MRLRAMAVVSALALGLAVPRAEAAFHLMNIVEVFPGTPASPGAQYVVLQMWSNGQNFLQNHTITFYDRFGASPVTFTFPNDPGLTPNGANQAKVLIANAAAQAFFSVTPDLVMTGTPIRPEGGKICFEVWDCVAWGNYVGDPTGVGTPFERPVGLRPGVAAIRRLDIYPLGSPAILEQQDDTGDSANDFRYGTPAPKNNANVVGTIPVAVCQNNVTEGLEQCDDGNPVPDDTCNATCDVTRLFADGFESTDVSRWHASAGTNADLSVTVAAAMMGTYGLQGVVNDTEGLFVQNDSPENEGRYRVRLRFDPNGFDPGEAQNHLRTRILIGFQAPQRRVFAIVLRRQSGQYAVMARARRDDNTQANSGFFNIDDGPHTIEVDWQRSVGSAGNGSLRLFIDGALVNTISAVDNDAAGMDFIRLGALSVKVGAAGTLYWDDLDSREETYVGP